MMKLRSVTAGAVATAMLATSVTPALAQGYPGSGYGRPGAGYGYGGGYRRHRDRIDAGDVIAGVAIIGIIAAIASAASSSNKRNTTSTRNRGSIGTEDAAADACANAAESRAGRDSRVTSIDDVRRSGDGYSVRGTIELGGYRDSSDRQPFTCSVRYGNVERVDLGNNTAYRDY